MPAYLSADAWLLAFLLGFLLVWSSITQAQEGTTREGTTQETPDAASELRGVVEELNRLDQWFSDSEAKRVSWLKDIQTQDRQIASVNRDIDQTRAALATNANNLEALEEQGALLNQRKAEQAQLIGEHIAAAYRLSGQDFLKQMLNLESPDKFDRLIRYHQYFSESRIKVLDEYRDTLTELTQNSQALETEQNNLAERQTQLAQRQENLEKQRSQREGLISQLDREAEDNQALYNRLEKDRLRLETLLAELRRRSAVLDGSEFLAAKGTLPMPLAGRIRNSFGSARAEGRMSWHGIDIAAQPGTPVKAVFRGRVIFSDWLRGFGLLTVLDHGDDYMTLYGHADSLVKKEGDWVESGELIARAGNSGGKNAVGVYFEVRHEGKPLDPVSWINR